MAQHVLDRRSVLQHRNGVVRQVAQHVDVVLALVTVAVAGLGVLMVYSATRAKLAAAGIDPHYYLKKQGTYVALGIVVMVIVTLVDYRRLEEWSWVVYGLVLVGLVAVLSPLGQSNGQATRWFSLGSFALQPSSFASLALIAVGAAYCARHQGDMTPRRVVVLLGLAALPILLVIKQPDLGTAIIMSVILMTMLVVAGVRARYLALIVVLAAGAMFLAVHFGVLKQYQIERLTVFISQGHHQTTKELRGASYNLDQSMTAIANGGLQGDGLFKGTLTNLSYVPEQQTDFIFTAIGEQLGFAGTATVLTLFGVLVWRVLRTAQLARDPLGRYLCAGSFGLIAFSVFQNAGMTMGIMPITGVPLPFMSYGGSATLAFFAAVGLVLNVGMRRFR